MLYTPAIMILTLTGASGTGKTTLANMLYQALPNALPLISYTTRKSRPTDLPGDYAFLSEQEFASMETHDDFLWTANVGETRYGTTKDSLRHALEDNSRIHVMILVPETVPNVHDFAKSIGMADQVKSFLFETPSSDVLRERMSGRGDDAESIQGRIETTGAFESKARATGISFIMIPDLDLEGKAQTVLKNILSSRT